MKLSVAWIAGCALVVVAVTGLGFVASGSAAWTTFDSAAVTAVNGRHSAFLDAVARALDLLFGPPFAVGIVLLVSLIIFAVTRRWEAAIRFAVVVTLPWLATDVIKVIVHRPRPNYALLPHPMIVETTNSYPSGHTAFAACLAVAIAITVPNNRWRKFAIMAVVALAASVAASRVYLGVHYPTDVIASVVYSIAAVTAASLLWSIAVTRRPAPRA